LVRLVDRVRSSQVSAGADKTLVVATVVSVLPDITTTLPVNVSYACTGLVFLCCFYTDKNEVA
jgi:hypothetical protein